MSRQRFLTKAVFLGVDRASRCRHCWWSQEAIITASMSSSASMSWLGRIAAPGDRTLPAARRPLAALLPRIADRVTGRSVPCREDERLSCGHVPRPPQAIASRIRSLAPTILGELVEVKAIAAPAEVGFKMPGDEGSHEVSR